MGQEEQGIDLYEGQSRGLTWGQFLRIYAAGIRQWRWQRPSGQPAGDKADRPMMLKFEILRRLSQRHSGLDNIGCHRLNGIAAVESYQQR